MSEPRDNSNDSEHEMPGPSDDERIIVEVEDEELSGMITEPSERERSHQPHAEAGISNGDNDSTLKIPTETVLLSELHGGCSEVPSSMDQSDNNGIVEEKTSVKETKVVDGQLENGNRLLENELKPIQLEEDRFKETPFKEEREGGEEDQFHFDPNFLEGDDDGSEEEQAAFMRELEKFHREMSLEFKPPKFYGEGLNCLKLWRAVTRLGGYDQVTSCKLWRQVGESFKPPKTCTTISWSFRCFYEKALLEYEKHKIRIGELHVPLPSLPEPMAVDSQAGGNQASGSGRARRDAAARAMQGWHSQRLLGNGEVGDPIIKDKGVLPLLKRDKHLKSFGSSHKKKKGSSLEHAIKVARTKSIKPQMDSVVVDVGQPADWVKINVRKTKDCFEVYALVPGLLREEVHVQSDPAGRLIISGDPEQPDNPWGVTPFKKVITLPSRIDPHQTSAVVTLHGQLFVRAPFEQLDI